MTSAEDGAGVDMIFPTRHGRRHCNRRLFSACPGQAGAGLIEVAISILVLSVGTIGLAGLQISAKRQGFEALQRTEAAALAMDLLERMRANPEALAEYQTDGVAVASPPPARLCDQASCSAGEMSRWDLWQWRQALSGAGVAGSVGGLVEPTGCVAVSGRLVTVAIAWRGYLSLAGPGADAGCGAGYYGPGESWRQLLRIRSWIGEGRP